MTNSLLIVDLKNEARAPTAPTPRWNTVSTLDSLFRAVIAVVVVVLTVGVVVVDRTYNFCSDDASSW